MWFKDNGTLRRRGGRRKTLKLVEYPVWFFRVRNCSYFPGAAEETKGDYHTVLYFDRKWERKEEEVGKLGARGD